MTAARRERGITATERACDARRLRTALRGVRLSVRSRR
jgi:hypothetical protein